MAGIIVGFSKPRKWKPLAWLIMKGYSIPYSHVYIKFWSTKFNRFLVYQASHTMVNFMGASVFDEEAEIIKEFSLDIADDDHLKMIRFAIDNAGKPYGIKDAVGLGVMRIFEIFGKKIKNPFADSRSYVCCELASTILKQYSSIDIPINSDDINPKQLYQILDKHCS